MLLQQCLNGWFVDLSSESSVPNIVLRRSMVPKDGLILSGHTADDATSQCAALPGAKPGLLQALHKARTPVAVEKLGSWFLV